MELTLEKDKVTRNGVVRYGDGSGHNLYLQPWEVKSLGNPTTIHAEIKGVDSAK